LEEKLTTSALRTGWVWDLIGALSGSDLTTPATDSETFTEVLPKFSMKYDLGPNAMIYGLAAKGFRSGGINLFPSEDPSLPLAYDPDYVWNYELGAKMGWLNNRVTLNGAAYYMDWQNVQDVGFSAIPLIGFITNLGDAHTSGVELELNAMLTDEFTMGVAAGWIIDAETDEDTINAPSGTPLSGVPEYNGNLFLQYQFPFGSHYNATINGNYNLVGESPQFYGSPVANPSYEVLSFNFSVDSGNWNTSLFIDNALNDYIQIRNLDNDRVGHGLVMRPRTIGLRFSTNF